MSKVSAETLITKHKVHSISKRIGVLDWLVIIVFNASMIKLMNKMIKHKLDFSSFSSVSGDHF